MVYLELKYLTDLQLHGSDWLESQLDQLIHSIGPRLLHLGRFHWCCVVVYQYTINGVMVTGDTFEEKRYGRNTSALCHLSNHNHYLSIAMVNGAELGFER